MTMNVGIVGCGLISEAHIRAWNRTPGFQVRGLVDTNREQAHKRAAEFNIHRVYDQLDQLIAECEVVDVCTPPQSHARIAEQAIEGRRHVVMEKPVVTDISDWDRLSARVREAQIKLAVIHNVKFLRSVQTAKRWVEEGRIGRVLRLHRDFLTHPATDRMLVGSDHWSHTLPGGRWYETLPHELYLTHWFLGPLDLANVTAIRTSESLPGAPADEVIVVLQGADSIATFQFSSNCQQNRRTLSLQGTKGRIDIDLLSDIAALSEHGDSRFKRAAGRAFLEAGSTLLGAALDRASYGWQHVQRISPHVRIIQRLGRSLQGEGEEPTPFAEVDYVIRMGDRIGREIDRQVR